MDMVVVFSVEAVTFGEMEVMGMEIRMASFKTIVSMLGLREKYQRISFRVITGVVHLCFSCDFKINYLSL